LIAGKAALVGKYALVGKFCTSYRVRPASLISEKSELGNIDC
jgi:hypothetical protein